jgi:hypothetical protein
VTGPATSTSNQLVGSRSRSPGSERAYSGWAASGSPRPGPHDLHAAAPLWLTFTGGVLSLCVVLAVRCGSGVTAAAVTCLAEPHRRAWLGRGMGVLPPGLARRLNSAVNLALTPARVLGRSRQSRQQAWPAVIQGPATRPVQGGIPVSLGLSGHEPHQMLKVLRPTVTVPRGRGAQLSLLTCNFAMRLLCLALSAGQLAVIHGHLPTDIPPHQGRALSALQAVSGLLAHGPHVAFGWGTAIVAARLATARGLTGATVTTWCAVIRSRTRHVHHGVSVPG